MLLNILKPNELLFSLEDSEAHKVKVKGHVWGLFGP